MGAVIIADDHPLMRVALRDVILDLSPEYSVLEMASYSEVKKTLQNQSPEHAIDLVLLDLNMPGMDGHLGVVSLRADFPDVPLIVVSANDDHVTIQRSLACGAAGFISKASQRHQISEAVLTVLAGGKSFPKILENNNFTNADIELARYVGELSPQELRALILLTEGRLNKQIAQEMGVTEATVKAHLTAIFRKLHVKSRTQAALAAHAFFSMPPR